MFYKGKRVNPPDWLNCYKCVCASNNTASKEAKIGRKNGCITIRFEDLNASLSVKERTSKKKIIRFGRFYEHD